MIFIKIELQLPKATAAAAEAANGDFATSLTAKRIKQHR